MKFLVSKKLIDNRPLYLSVLWMLAFIIIALSLNVAAKGIEFGITPSQWISHILGNEEQFIEPLAMKDLLLALHTELFGLILVFILLSALLMRTSRAKELKITILIFGITTLLLYVFGLIASLWVGSIATTLSYGAFVLFHLVMTLSTVDTVVLIFRKRF
jgi:uncharacterized protein YacL